MTTHYARSERQQQEQLRPKYLFVDLIGNGGPDRDRTDDLVIANDALSQLSYRPFLPMGGPLYGERAPFCQQSCQSGSCHKAFRALACAHLKERILGHGHFNLAFCSRA